MVEFVYHVLCKNSRGGDKMDRRRFLKSLAVAATGCFLPGTIISAAFPAATITPMKVVAPDSLSFTRLWSESLFEFALKDMVFTTIISRNDTE